MLECQIQKQIIDYLENNQYYVIKLISTTKAGIPDLLCIREGKCIFIEVKRPPARARPLQLHRMKELQKYGAIAFVAHSVEEVKTVLEQTYKI